MTLPSTAATPVNTTFHQDFADISSLLAVRTAKAGTHYLHVNCIKPRQGMPAGDKCCDRLATVREVLAEDSVGATGLFLSIRLRGWKGATFIELFDRVGRGILLTHAGRTFLSEARAVLARVRTIKPVLDR
jgi:hypothetical protein